MEKRMEVVQRIRSRPELLLISVYLLKFQLTVMQIPGSC